MISRHLVCTEASKFTRKSDLPPSQPVFTPSDIPKSMARILNAEAVQNAFRTRRKAGLVEGGKANSGDNKRVAGNKRKRGVEEEDKSKQELKIKPGESLAHFRRYMKYFSEGMNLTKRMNRTGE